MQILRHGTETSGTVMITLNWWEIGITVLPQILYLYDQKLQVTEITTFILQFELSLSELVKFQEKYPWCLEEFETEYMW